MMLLSRSNQSRVGSQVIERPRAEWSAQSLFGFWMAHALSMASKGEDLPRTLFSIAILPARPVTSLLRRQHKWVSPGGPGYTGVQILHTFGKASTL